MERDRVVLVTSRVDQGVIYIASEKPVLKQ